MPNKSSGERLIRGYIKFDFTVDEEQYLVGRYSSSTTCCLKLFSRFSDSRKCTILAKSWPKPRNTHLPTLNAHPPTLGFAPRPPPPPHNTTQHPPLTDTDAHHTNEPNPTTTLPNPTQHNAHPPTLGFAPRLPPPLPTTAQHPPLTDTDAHHTNEPNSTTTLPNPNQPNSRTRRNPPHLAPSLDTDRIEYRPRGMGRRSGRGLPTGHRAGGK